jgi:hypothetical protein
MDITVYLPDEIGERAKAAGLNLSRLLRDAAQTELERRAVIATTLGQATEHLLDLEDEGGTPYTGRITGTVIARDDSGTVYLTTDERVILYDFDKLEHWEIDFDFPEVSVEDQLGDLYVEVMRALGKNPVIDL